MENSNQNKKNNFESYSYGRKIIYSSYTQKELNKKTITEILNEVFPIHLFNRSEIDYLEKYVKGIQPILYKTNIVRPEINNIVVENSAFGIVEFKKSYIFGKPIKYVQLGEISTEEISSLNKYMSVNNKQTLDSDLAESLYISGIGHRICLPNKKENFKSPFTIHNLDSKNTFVVYERAIGNAPLLAVTYYAYKKDGRWFYKGSVYTEKEYYDFEFTGSVVISIGEPKQHILGSIPIVEYRLNKTRIGLIEIGLSILNALNRISSNDLDGIEQQIEALLVFINQDIDKETFQELIKLGAIKVTSPDASRQADVKLLINDFSHEGTQVLYERLYASMLFILGLPRMKENSSGGDTGEARRLGEGWTIADLRADQDETSFKLGENQILDIALRICKKDPKCNINKLEVEDIESKFERNKSDNLLVKTQSLTNLKSAQISPQTALSVVGLFSDPTAVCDESKKFYGDSWWQGGKELINDKQVFDKNNKNNESDDK